MSGQGERVQVREEIAGQLAAFGAMPGETVDEDERRRDLGLAVVPAPSPSPGAGLGAGGHSCRGGWLPEGPDGEARPCLRCKPWLAGKVAR